MKKEKYTFEEFISIIDRLRGENGCPWDRAQTHESLRASLIEETYEAAEAIDKNDMENLCEELGDILLQVVLHSRIESEKNGFNIYDVIDRISRKMILRHTHIFGNDTANTKEDVILNWEKNKKIEKGFKTQTEIMKAVPKALPSIIRAKKVQSKAADVNFDFENMLSAFDKVKEEFKELNNEILKENGNIDEEFGDLLFALVNLSRFLKINADFSLTKATEKFINRFEYVENSIIKDGAEITDISAQDMDKLWNESKQHKY